MRHFKGATALYDGPLIVALAPSGESIVGEAETFIREADLSNDEAEEVRAAVSLEN